MKYLNLFRPRFLNVALSVPFWLVYLDSLIFNILVFVKTKHLAYAYQLFQFQNQIIKFFVSALVVYILMSFVVFVHKRFEVKSKKYELFWDPSLVKIKTTVVLVAVAIIFYIITSVSSELHLNFIYIALISFFALVLNWLASLAFGHIPSFTSTSGYGPGTEVIVFYTHFPLLIPIILFAFIWNYFLACVIFFIIGKIKNT